MQDCFGTGSNMPWLLKTGTHHWSPPRNASKFPWQREGAVSPNRHSDKSDAPKMVPVRVNYIQLLRSFPFFYVTGSDFRCTWTAPHLLKPPRGYLWHCQNGLQLNRSHIALVAVASHGIYFSWFPSVFHDMVSIFHHMDHMESIFHHIYPRKPNVP